MARRFFYVSLGILALAIAYGLGANEAGAASGAQIHTLGHNGWLLDSVGQVWQLTPANCWERMPAWDIPVPVSSVAMWDNHALITTSGVAWRHDGISSWIECGPLPAPVPVEGASFGAVKEFYR